MTVRGCLYEKWDGIKNFYMEPLYGDFSSRYGITRQDGMISVPPFGAWIT